MKLVRRFFRYSLADRALLAKAAIVVLLVRLGLNLLRFPRLRRLLYKTANKTSKPADPQSISRIAWAVAAVSRHVPMDATCLTQAMAAEVLLGRLGQSSDLRVGVAKDGDEFQAHAWLEIDGEVIIGDNVDISRFTTLPSLETEAK